MTLAFKEWSFIVDALGKGMQNIIIRKGGIHEDEFSVRGKKFLLMPTIFHQAPEMLKDNWLPKLNGYAYNHIDDTVTIPYYAEVADTKQVSEWVTVQKLDPYHAWKENVIKERFERWEKNVNVLVVQIYKLKTPLRIEMLPEYGGCKSWVDIEEDVIFEGQPIVNPNIR